MIDTDLIDKVLHAIQREIGTSIRPAITAPDARTGVDMAYLLLGWMRTYLSKSEALKERRLDSISKLIGREPNADLTEMTVDESISHVASRIGMDWPQADATDLAVFSRLAAVEGEYLQSLDPEPPQQLFNSFLGGRRALETTEEKPVVEVSDETLTEYLRGRFPEYHSARASGMRRLPGGMGKDTILFRIDGVPPYEGDVVMRMDLDGLATGNTVVDEFPILQLVYRQGVAVPEPLWCEPNEQYFGAAFIVVRRVGGSTDTSSWMSNPTAATKFGKVLAQTMAKIHAIHPPDLGREGPGKTAIQATRAYIEATRTFYRSRAREINPRIEAGFVFLLARSPTEDGAAPSLVHGDIGFHNLMMENGDVTAVLDWDYSHIGDPAEDVSYCRPFVERILPWDDFLREYYAHGGQPYTLEKDRYYAVWRDVRNAAACVGALGALFISKQGSIKLATAGLIYGPRFEMSTLSAIMAVNPGKA